MHTAQTLTPETTPEAPEEAWPLVADLVYHTVHKFAAQFPGDTHDYKSRAHELWMDFHPQYAAGFVAGSGRAFRDSYACETFRAVWYGLYDDMRQQARRARLAPMASLEEISADVGDQEPACLGYEQRSAFDAAEWGAGLPPDAQHLLYVCLDPDAALEDDIEARGGSLANVRAAVKDRLRQEWTRPGELGGGRRATERRLQAAWQAVKKELA